MTLVTCTDATTMFPKERQLRGLNSRARRTPFGGLLSRR